MSVKTIFKVLISTMALLVLIPLAIELVNIFTVGMELKQMTKVAANQALSLYTQETYRTTSDGTGLAARMSSFNTKSVKKDSSGNIVKDTDGNIVIDTDSSGNEKSDTYVTGSFYGVGLSSEQEIYEKLYIDSDAFNTFCTTNGTSTTPIKIGGTGGAQARTLNVKIKVVSGSGVSGNSMIDIFPQLKMLYYGVTNQSDSISIDEYDTDSAKAAALSYAENRYTPVNIGIAYFDPQVTNRMFQWNLAQLLSNTSDSNVQIDDNGISYVNFNGFKCYVQDAYISGYTYYVFNSQTDSALIEKYTNMKASALTNIGGENNYIVVVGVDYAIPIAYEGITPIKRIMNFAWTREVDGFDGQSSVVISDAADEENQLSGKSGNSGLWNNSSEDLETLMNNGYSNDGTATGQVVAIGALTGGTSTGLKNSDSGESGILDTGGELYFVLTR
jgi:hypothetical protein